MAQCKGGDDTRREAITGRLSGRGRESIKRKMMCFRWRNAQKRRLFYIDRKQFLLSLSFLYLVSDALFKHFVLIQRLKIITSLNDMTKCKNIDLSVRFMKYQLNKRKCLISPNFDLEHLPFMEVCFMHASRNKTPTIFSIINNDNNNTNWCL